MPTNYFEYNLACICIVLLGILYEAILTTMSIQEHKWRIELESNNDDSSAILPSAVRLPKRKSKNPSPDLIRIVETAASGINEKQDNLLLSTNLLKYVGGYGDGFVGVRISITRSICRFVMAALSYSLMLITMTFNIGLFISVCLGIAIGSFLFAPISFKVLGSKTDLVRASHSCC